MMRWFQRAVKVSQWAGYDTVVILDGDFKTGGMAIWDDQLDRGQVAGILESWVGVMVNTDEDATRTAR